MPLTDSLTAVPDQVLEAIGAVQDLFIATVTTVTDAAKPLIDKLPPPPFAGELPDPAAVVENTFAAAARFLTNQKEFSLRLIEAYRPAKAPAGATAKSTKAA